jgi:hypothetical protein
MKFPSDSTDPFDLLTDGRNLFRLVGGRRVWISTPPLDRLMEILDEQEQADAHARRRLATTDGKSHG